MRHTLTLVHRLLGSTLRIGDPSGRPPPALDMTGDLRSQSALSGQPPFFFCVFDIVSAPFKFELICSESASTPQKSLEASVGGRHPRLPHVSSLCKSLTTVLRLFFLQAVPQPITSNGFGIRFDSAFPGLLGSRYKYCNLYCIQYCNCRRSFSWLCSKLEEYSLA